mgnify:CR=1 FL=1
MKKVVIIGMGLIGGSLGMAIKNKDLAEQVVGVSRNIDHLKEAKKKCAREEYTIDPIEAVKDADLVFITTPINIIAATVKTIVSSLKEGAIVTDVGSSKLKIVEEVGSAVSGNIHFIGGHPMAGTEHSGIIAATKFLFEGANYILTPTEKTNKKALEKLKDFLSKLDVNIMVMPAAKHDLVVAGISHMPIAVSAALVNAIADMEGDRDAMLAAASGGFRDTTRIAAGNVEMALDMFTTNKTAVLTMIEKFKDSLEKLENMIRDGKVKEITAELEKAKELRAGMYAVKS